MLGRMRTMELRCLRDRVQCNTSGKCMRHLSLSLNRFGSKTGAWIVDLPGDSRVGTIDGSERIF
jgi:hypothetical protein